MIPERLSATAVDTFENCEYRYKAERLDRVPDIQGSAAGLGTVFHNTVQWWVESGSYLTNAGWTEWEAKLEEEWYKVFSTLDRYDELVEMSQDWLSTHGQAYWSERQVISTEQENYFVIKFSEAPSEPGATFFRFEWRVVIIIDRLDDKSNGQRKVIEVVDYKTWMQPVQPDEVQYKIQARMYALFVQLMYPEVETVWVTFDQTRYVESGASFSKDENRKTYAYLQKVSRRIFASDGSKRTLNIDCRWCVAKATCPVLLANIEGGGMFSDLTIEQVVDKRALVHAQVAALKPMLEQLNEVLMDFCDNNGELQGIEGHEHVMKLRSRSKRTPQTNMIRMVVGDIISAKYPKMNLTEIKKMLATEDLTQEQIAQVNSFIIKEKGSVYPETKPKSKIK